MPKITEEESYTRFERARVIGARSLQIEMGAPTLLDVEGSSMDKAREEFESGVIPIAVRRPEPGEFL